MKRNIIQSLTLRLLYGVICRSVLRFFFHVKFYQRKQLRDKKQFIIIANHTSHMDTICLLSSMPENKIVKVKPVAAQDFFGKNKFRARLSNFFVNTLLISRKMSRDIKNESVDRILKSLDEGYSLIFYPEGTRGTSDKLQELKKGIARILIARPHICYIPAHLTGMRQLFSLKNIFIPSKASVTFGNPMTIHTSDRNDIMSEIEKSLLMIE